MSLIKVNIITNINCLSFICLTDCKEKLKSSLFIMGEIGANDYNMAFHFASKTIEEVNRMGLVFDNVKSIKKAIEVSQRTS